MDVMFSMSFKTADGTELFDLTSPKLVRRDAVFLENKVVYRIMQVVKRPSHEFMDLGVLSKRQRFSVDVLVEPDPTFRGTIEDKIEITTGTVLQLMHRVYYLESLISGLMKPADSQNMYG